MMWIDFIIGAMIGVCLKDLLYVFRGIFNLAIGKKEYPIIVLDDRATYGDGGYKIFLTEEELGELENNGSDVHQVIGWDDKRFGASYLWNRGLIK